MILERLIIIIYKLSNIYDHFARLILKVGNLEFKRKRLFGMKSGISLKMKVCPMVPSLSFTPSTFKCLMLPFGYLLHLLLSVKICI